MMSRGVYLAQREKARSNVDRVRRWDASSQLLRGTLLKVGLPGRRLLHT